MTNSVELVAGKDLPEEREMEKKACESHNVIYHPGAHITDPPGSDGPAAYNSFIQTTPLIYQINDMLSNLINSIAL